MNVTTQRGFTLVEMAVVVLIIGLLVGGVIKGQELIYNAWVKDYVADFRAIPVYLYSYQDRFHALPGDDIAASTHVGGTPPTTPAGTLGNGMLNGPWNSITDTDETCLFWQHLRLAHIAYGTTVVNCAPGGGYYPQNFGGGQMGIQSSAGFATITGPTVMTGSYIVCSTNILGKFVLELDRIMDDGNPQTGSMRAIHQTEAALAAGIAADTATVNANSSDSFVVCMSM